MTLQSALDSERPLPWLFELAAELADEPISDLADDAGTVARSLSSAADLFDLPAVCTCFDTTLVAEAAGCPVEDDAVVEGVIETVDDAFDVDLDAVPDAGRVPTFVDATERLSETCDAAVLGGITGPALLAEQLLVGSDEAEPEVREEAVFTAGEVCVELANTYLDAGADGVAILEPDGLDATLYRDAAEPIVNVLGHYEAGGAVVTDEASEADIRTAGEIGFDAITGAVADSEAALAVADEVGIDLGIGVPEERFADGPDAVAAFREEVSADARLSSQWTVPAGTPPEAVHELMGSG